MYNDNFCINIFLNLQSDDCKAVVDTVCSARAMLHRAASSQSEARAGGGDQKTVRTTVQTRIVVSLDTNLFDVNTHSFSLLARDEARDVSRT